MSTVPKLFQPLQLGDITLQHRVVLAPLTRMRADDAHVPQGIATEYYEQRAQAPGTLLITEGTFVSAEAGGFAKVPGIWNDAQVEAWKKVVDAVHAKGSYIYLQLWSLGRGGYAEVIRADGYPYVSASPIPLEDRTDVPQELSKADIKRYVGHYAQAASNAVHRAGFDGVEINSVNGFLLDQFIQDPSNQRTDEYGGSVENRGRLLLEITDAVVAAVGVKKTAVRLSPWGRWQGMGMEDPIPTFSHVVRELAKHHSDLAYIHFVEPRISGDDATDPDILASSPQKVESNDFAREIWGSRTFLTAGGFKLNTALEVSEKYDNGAVAFGRYFIANPDLPIRLRAGIPLNAYNRATFYTGGAVGYIDYPQAQEVQG